MTPNVGEPVLRPGVDYIVDILLLTSGSNVFTVKMIDRIEFQAFGAVSGHEVDGSAGGFEDMTGVRDSSTEGLAVAGEDTHAISRVCGRFVIKEIGRAHV